MCAGARQCRRSRLCQSRKCHPTRQPKIRSSPDPCVHATPCSAGKARVRIIPVLDIRGGLAVHAVAGNRKQYQPLQSVLIDSTDPVQVAAALRARGFAELYVADLDAIESGEPEFSRYQQLAELGMRLWLDCGVRSVAMAQRLLAIARECPRAPMLIVGLESLAHLHILADLAAMVSAEQLVFSLDLFAGKPRSPRGEEGLNALELAQYARSCGVRNIIVLDLACVGTARGVNTLGVCRALRSSDWHEIVTGGGVGDKSDLQAVAKAGCTAALVSSALHSGRIGSDQFELTSREPASQRPATAKYG